MVGEFEANSAGVLEIIEVIGVDYDVGEKNSRVSYLTRFVR